MKLFDGTFPLQHDDFCHKNLDFNRHLKIIGFYREALNKYYVVECNVCNQDYELFREGLFSLTKGGLVANQVPCGCSIVPKWEKWQQEILAKRGAEVLGYSIVNMPPYVNQKTKITVNCKKHGDWETTYTKLVNILGGCRKCASEKVSENRNLRNGLMITRFLSEGKFVDGTKFTRSDRMNTQGAKNYWNVFCPTCQFTYESHTSDLKRGNRGCACSVNPTQAYINSIYWENVEVALKFGITSNLTERVYRQNLRSEYNISNLAVWQFPSKIEARKAELTCKQKFDCGIIASSLMKDGFTETTHIHNKDAIIKIYESYGGVLIN